MLVIQPLDEIQGPSQLHDHGLWLMYTIQATNTFLIFSGTRMQLLHVLALCHDYDNWNVIIGCKCLNLQIITKVTF